VAPFPTPGGAPKPCPLWISLRATSDGVSAFALSDADGRQASRVSNTALVSDSNGRSDGWSAWARKGPVQKVDAEAARLRLHHDEVVPIEISRSARGPGCDLMAAAPDDDSVNQVLTDACARSHDAVLLEQRPTHTLAVKITSCRLIISTTPETTTISRSSYTLV
jgi:hypothetical protein